MNIFRNATVWIGGWIVFGIGFQTAAQAQSSAPATSLKELQLAQTLKPEESVQIFDNEGSRLKARFSEVSTSGVTVMVNGQRRDLPLSEVKEIRHRRPERWWNGMVIGMVVGGVVGALAETSSNSEFVLPRGALVPIAAIEFGAFGALIDFAIRSSETVFVRPGVSSNHGMKISPTASKGHAGVRFTWTF